MADKLIIKIDGDTADFEKSLNGIGKTAEKAFGGIKSVGTKTFTAIGAGVSAVSGALGGLATAGIKYNASMEQYYASFETLLGSGERATALMEDLKKYAAATPFEMTDIAKSTQTLLAFGIESDKVMDITKMLGDVSLGNSEKFSALSLAFGQMSSTGRLMGQDLNQMINAGFNPLLIISQKTGESMESLKDKMSKGQITVDMVTQAFRDATSEGGQFYKSLESQSKTFEGQLSTLKDNVNQLLGDITSGTFKGLAGNIIPMLSGYIQQLSDVLRTQGSAGLAKAVGDIVADIITKITSYAPQIITIALSIITALISGLNANLSIISSSARTIFYTLVNGIRELIPELIPLVGEIAGLFAEGWITYQGLIMEVGISVITAFVTGIANNIPTIVPAAVSMINQIIDTITTSAPMLINGAVEIITGLANGISTTIPTLIPTIISLILSIVEMIINNLPMILGAALQIIQALGQGLINSIPVLVAQLPSIINSIISFIKTSLPQIIRTGVTLFVSLVEALPDAIKQIVAVLPDIINSVIDTLMSNLPDIIQAGVDMFTALITNLPEIIFTIAGAIPDIIFGIVNAIWDNRYQLVEAGKNLIEGLWEGIQSMGGWIEDKVKGLISGIVGKAKDILGIGSPSKVFMEIGGYVTEGLGIGIESQNSALVKAAKDQIAELSSVYEKSEVGLNIKNRLSSAKSALNSAFSGSISGAQLVAQTISSDTSDTFYVYVNGSNGEKLGADLYREFQRRKRYKGGL